VLTRHGRKLYAVGSRVTLCIVGGASQYTIAATCPKMKPLRIRQGVNRVTFTVHWRGTVPGKPTTTTTAPAATTTTAATTSAPSPAPEPRACSRGTLAPLAGVDLSGAGPGLVEVAEPVQRYTVNGYTVSQVRAQLAACTPTPPWWGEARWWLNYKYRYASSSGACSLTSVSVGLHTATSMPAWNDSPDAEAGLAAHWNSFNAGLATHEQGHVEIARSGAAKLLTDLQNTAVDCASVAEQLSAVFTADLGALNQAEEDYDVSTGHGATQGATF
jgi:predicted secreted Zn-dependent protease